jgi:hypothetical protein
VNPPPVRLCIFSVAMKLSFDEADLRPLIEQVVSAAFSQLQADQGQLGQKIAFTEPEAAALLSLRPHVLRDARLRGEIAGARVGKRILYQRDELLRFLHRQRQL